MRTAISIILAVFASSSMMSCGGSSGAGSAEINTLATLLSIAVAPANPTLAVGESRQFTADGTYSDGSHRDLTSEVFWYSSSTSVATIGTSGMATAVGSGTTVISAVSSVSGHSTLSVSPTVTSIAVTPANARLAIGKAQQFTAMATYSDDSTRDLTSQVLWASSDPGVASISATGLATTLTNGVTNVTATFGSVSGSTSLFVVSGTVGGRSFTPVEVRAIPAGTGSTPCNVALGSQTASLGVKSIEIEFTSYTNACGDFASSTCLLHMGAQSVTILVAKVNPLGTEPALTAGTYTLNPSPTSVTPDGSGMLNLGYAQALGTNATCIGTPSAASSGTIRLDSLGDPVTGYVSVTFQDGSKLEGDFSAPICAGVSPDVCQLAASGSTCTGANCVP